MDGTLIDSEPYWIAAEADLAARFGAPWTREDGLSLVGNPLHDSAKILQSRGIDLPAQAIIDDLIASVTARVLDRMPWLDDARTLLDAVIDAGIPCALVTMSVGGFVDTFLDASGPVFQAVVTGDQVARGKPDPEAYLLAAARLGVDPAQCVAIEDSVVGTRAAHASGAKTIGVRRHIPLPVLPGMSRVTSLDGIGIEQLRDIRAGEVLLQPGA